jgi:hypothetical protein
MYHACLTGAAYYTLMSVLNLMKRNEVPFNDGGLNVDIPALIPHIERQALLYREQWEQQKLDKKIAMNIEGVYGIDSPASEYSIIQGWLGRAGHGYY